MKRYTQLCRNDFINHWTLGSRHEQSKNQWKVFEGLIFGGLFESFILWQRWIKCSLQNCPQRWAFQTITYKWSDMGPPLEMAFFLNGAGPNDEEVRWRLEAIRSLLRDLVECLHGFQQAKLPSFQGPKAHRPCSTGDCHVSFHPVHTHTSSSGSLLEVNLGRSLQHVDFLVSIEKAAISIYWQREVSGKAVFFVFEQAPQHILLVQKDLN